METSKQLIKAVFDDFLKRHQLKVPLEYCVNAGMPEWITVEKFGKNFKPDGSPTAYVRMPDYATVYAIQENKYYRSLTDAYLIAKGLDHVWIGGRLYMLNGGYRGYVLDNTYQAAMPMSADEIRCVHTRLTTGVYNEFSQ